MDNPTPLAPTTGRIAPEANAPLLPTAWAQSEARLRREESTKPSDYVGAIYRQDGFIDGMVASYVGSQLMPQENYFVGSDPAWEQLRKDLWPEHETALYKAVSPTHAQFLRDRLLQKQQDMLRLGDLGMSGEIGRFALNVLMPENLVFGLTTFAAARGLQAAGRVGQSQVSNALANAEARVAAGTGRAVAAGTAVGAAENAAFEKLRQEFNFEQNTSAIVESLLLGGAFSLPLAALGARSANRMADAAQREVNVLRALEKSERGEALDAADAAAIRETVEIRNAVDDLHAGRIDEDTFTARVDNVLSLEDGARAWLNQFSDRLSAEGRSIVDEFFPGSRAPARQAPSPTPETIPTTNGAPPVAPADPTPPVASGAQVAAFNAANPVVRNTGLEGLAKLLDQRRESRARDAADAERMAAKEAAWADIEARRAAQRQAEEEAAIRQRELQRMAEEGEPDPAAANAVAPEETPPVTPEAPAEPPRPDPDEVLESPRRTAESFVGEVVSWQDSKGAQWEGRVTRVSPAGKLVVEDAYTGAMKAVAHTEVDQYGPASETPEGFLPGSIGAAQISQIANIASQRTAMSKIRLDYFATLNRSKNEKVRELAFALVKDAIQVDDKMAQGWTASEYKRQIQRQLGGSGFHIPFNLALEEAQKAAGVRFWQRHKFNALFAELVSRETRGDVTVAQQYPALHASVVKAAKAMKETYAKALEEMQRAGVEGAANVPPNDLYVNRVWRFDRIREAMQQHGRAQVVALLAKAIKVPGYTNNLGKAEAFLNTLFKLEFDAAGQNIALAPRDMATLRNELAATNRLTPQEIDDLVDVMFDARAVADSDAGRAANLKFRFDIDETMTDVLPTGRLSVQDLFENDARVLMDTYLNSVGGQIGLAKVGFKSAADWRRAIADAGKEPDADLDPSFQQEVKYLEDLYRYITGRPMSVADFSGTARIAQAFRGLTRGVTLGQLGLTAAFEMHRSFALFGFSAMMQSMPSFRNFIRAIRQGYIPEKGLAEDIVMMTGLGAEMAGSYARAFEVEGGWAYGSLNRFEHFTNRTSHVIDVLSGNASFTPLTRQMAAMGATRQAFEVAMGRRKLTAAEKRRWVGQGVSDNPAVVNGQPLAGTSDLDQMLDALKTWSTQGPGGTLQSIDYENWAANDRGTYETFQLFVSRQARDAIQDHDIGETMPWMHTTLGKMFGELKTFMLVAHAKNFAKNLEYRDSTSLALLMIGIMSESMAYSLQTAINFPGELDERLTAERIAQAVAGRLAMGGFTSVIAGTGYHILTGGDILFDAGTTKNTDSRVAYMPPSFMVAQKLLNLPSLVVGDLIGPGTATQKEVRDGLSGLPGARLLGVPATIRYLTEGLPTVDPDAGPSP